MRYQLLAGREPVLSSQERELTTTKACRCATAVIGILMCMVGTSGAQDTDNPLGGLSLSDLLKVRVTSVSKRGEDATKSPAVVDVITHEKIRAYGYRTIYEALVDIPGFWPIQDVNDKLLGVRGVHASTSQKYLVLINGKRLTENLWNLADLDYNIPVANVKRVEVLRGPGSAIYGRSALTAVINIITFDGAEIDGVQWNLGLGDHGYRNFGFTYGTETADGGNFQMYGHYATMDGEAFVVPAAEDGATHPVDGVELVDRFGYPSLSLSAEFHTNDWTFSARYQNRFYQHPRAGNGGLIWQDIDANEFFSEAYKERKPGEEHNYLVLDVDRFFEAGRSKHTVSLNYTHSRLRLREITKPFRDVSFPEDFPQEGLDQYGLGEMFEFDIEANRLGLEYFGQMEIRPGRDALWGVEIYRTEPTFDGFSSNYVATVQGSQINRAPTSDGAFRELPGGIFDRLRVEWLYSAFGELKFALGSKAAIHAGARYDVHVKGEDYKGEGTADRYPDPAADERRDEIEESESQLSPRLALVYQPMGSDDLTLKAIYNKSFIAPGYFYRYADPSTSYAGGPWLKAETLDSFMLSAETAQNRYTLRGVYFLNVNEDLLTRDTSLSPPRYTSLGKLAMQGFEADMSYELGAFSAFASYSYLVGVPSKSDDASAASWIMDDDSIKNFPKHHGSIGVVGYFMHRRMSASLLGRAFGSILSPLASGEGAGTIAKIDSNYTVNATVRYVIPKGNGIDIAASVYNLFDEDIKLGGTVARPYHQPGRWFAISVIWKL